MDIIYKYRIHIVVALIFVLVIIGLFNLSAKAGNRPTYQDVTSSDILNGTYQVWQGEVSANFKNGKAEDKTAHISSSIDQSALGDINGDKIRDGLAIITTARGDSMDELFVIFKQNNILQTKALDIPLTKGNTVRNIRKVTINQDRTIDLELDILAPNDPHCCASLHGIHRYKFQNNQLVLIK
ncbi:MAG TPA: hypothetical protein VFA52_02635 [Candidatus Paceibacterota bacterium]|nr:hypothetical protein [Candidatus Paceibacterota bacterium]